MTSTPFRGFSVAMGCRKSSFLFPKEVSPEDVDLNTRKLTLFLPRCSLMIELELSKFNEHGVHQKIMHLLRPDYSEKRQAFKFSGVSKEYGVAK